jgi:hypothetical protein
MNIPDKVKIGGTTYNVIYNSRPCKSDVSTEAEIIYDMGTITLREDSHACKEFQEMAFIHECVHGILYQMGLEQSDEDLTNRIGKGLYAFIKDNPDIFKEER